MPDLTIHGLALSTYVRTVRLLCEEKGIAYRLNPVRPGEIKDLGLQPFGKLPAVTDGDFELFETWAIVRYLDETREGPSFRPGAPRSHALMDQWISVINDVIYDAMVRRVILNYAFPRGPDGRPDRAVIDAALPEVRDQLALLDRAVGARSHLVDDQLTLADLFLGPILFYLRRVPEGPALMAAAANLERAYALLAARPSFVATEPELPPDFAA